MIKQIIKKVTQILSGYFLLFTGKRTDKSEYRKSICLTCDKRKYLICGECGCFISAKVLIEEEECPIGKW